jgi:hypothetical protein
MTQNKIAPMTTIIKIPIINESTTISSSRRRCSIVIRRAPSLAKNGDLRLIWSERLGSHHDAEGEDYVSDDRNPKAVQRDKRN